MCHWNDDNPFASFGLERPTVPLDDEENEDEDIEDAAESTPSLYDVELLGSWLRFPFNRTCLLGTRGDTFFFSSGKKHFEYSRADVNQLSKRRTGGSIFRCRMQQLRIRFSLIFTITVQLTAMLDGNTTLRVAKLIAWSKTSSDDEMEPIIRKAITELAWNWIPLFAWIPLAISLGFSLSVFANHGLLAALGPLHGASLVFIGFVVAMLWPNTRWAATLPTGCLACAVDYLVRSFFAQNADETVSYRMFAGIMLFFAGICYAPVHTDAEAQRAFARELKAAETAEPTTKSSD